MWAIQPVFARFSYSDSGIVETLTVMAMVAAAVTLPYALLTGGSGLKITRRQLPKVVYVALAGTVVADMAYFWAFTKIPVVNAVLIGHLQPVFVVLIGYFFLKEDRLTRFDYAGIVVLLAAGTLVSARTPENLRAFRLGSAAVPVVLLSTFAWATCGIVTRKYLREMNAGVLTFYRFVIAAGGFALCLVLTTGTLRLNRHQAAVGVVVGTGYVLYYEGLKRIKAAQVAALELSTPFFAALLGYAFLGEGVSLMQWGGIALLFSGTYLLSRKEPEPAAAGFP